MYDEYFQILDSKDTYTNFEFLNRVQLNISMVFSKFTPLKLGHNASEKFHRGQTYDFSSHCTFCTDLLKEITNIRLVPLIMRKLAST